MASQDSASGERKERPVEPLRSYQPSARPFPRHNVPVRRTSFVGRAMELAELAGLLAAPDCRLLTIIGPGGIGKTRLALEVVGATRESFEDGVVFVALDAIGTTQSIAPALADAIGCTLTGIGDVREQVARYLRATRMLLVLDNFEHLLAEAPWLGELLATAPGLRVLVTSREALNIQEEWRYPLAGLGVPPEGVEDPWQFEAVRLFVERAKQVRPDFSFATERDGVVRLCRITEGLPLALELAAAWIKTLACVAIADEIEGNVAFLASGLRNIPARHRSMQAAFDHSWTLLTADERRLFRRLAVFRGGFDRTAAEQVAGATLPLLSSLVDKSLVRFTSAERFHLHELLRQYAEDHLRAVPKEAGKIREAHRNFYLSFVADRFSLITGGGQRDAIVEIDTELANIRLAWQDAVAACDIDALGRVSHTLTLFFDFLARYREGLALLEEGVQLMRAADPSPFVDRTLAAMLIDVARCHHRLFQLPAMRAALAEAEERYARLGTPPPPGHMTDPQVWRGILALLDGQYAEAGRLGEEAVRRNTAGKLLGNLSPAWWVRAAAALWQEDTDAASEYARQSTDATLAAGDRWHLAYCFNLQGHIATAREDYVEARRLYEAAYAIREEFGDPEGMAGALGHLAKVAARQSLWDEAEQLYRRGLLIARDVGDMAMVINLVNGLGVVACGNREYVAAGQHFAEALRLAIESRYMRYLLTLLVSVGDWFLQTGRPEEAVAPLSIARAHPASDNEARIRARQLLSAAEAALPSETYAAAHARSQGIEPSTLAELLLPVLTAPLPPGYAPTLPPSKPERPVATAALVEPLTERELAVLRLIASGYSNREIADELFLAVNTVRSYSQQLYGKLGVGSRTRAVARARELGLLG